jgi:hypothetical protein
MRVVLVAAVAFLAVYMVVLRLRAATVEAPPPASTPAGNVNTGKPAITGFGKAVEAAKGAAAATEATQDAEARATGAATGAGSAKGAGTDGIPLPVARAMARHQVLALLFTNRTSADDRAVGAALRKVDRFDGRVYVHAAPLKALARYGRITRGADVQQSPTVVVVDRELRATDLVGYVDRLTIQQAILDAMRSSGGAISGPFRRRLNAYTSSVAHDLNAIPEPTTAAEYVGALRPASARFDAYVRAVSRIPARGRSRAVKRAVLSDLRAMRAARHGLAAALGAQPSAAKLDRLVPAARRRDATAARRFTRRAERQHLVSTKIPGLPHP